jgi:hypothetical protein
MKKLLILLGWLFITPTILITVISSAYRHEFNQELLPLELPKFTSQDKTIFAASSIPGQVKGISTSIKTADARPLIITEFLKTNGSPLTPYEHYGEFLTRLADKYDLDFRLLPSIMMQESNLCKKIPEGTFNCLGLGIHSRGTWGFNSFEENFEAAAQILKKNYIDKGLTTPEKIQTKYTPSSNGSWQFSVNHFMDVLEKAEFKK